MIIYLMRHARPIEASDWHGADEERPLSPKGQLELHKALQKIQKSDFKPTLVLTSPFLRAKQTANEVADALGAVPIEVEKDAASGVRVSVMRDIIRKRNKDGVLVVGHMPDLALFGGALTPTPTMMEENMKPGEIWAVETGNLDDGWGRGQLLWRKKLEDW